MNNMLPIFVTVSILVGCIVAFGFVFLIAKYGSLWLQAKMSGAEVSLLDILGMSLRRVSPSTIVTAQIMGKQAGLNIDRATGMSAARLEAHFLAGGDVTRVLQAIIAAQRAGIHLDFDRAAAMDLAGRDILEAVRISVSPKVIDCPTPGVNGIKTLSAVAKNGVELLVHARVTVRTNLDQLIGGATEETIVARVCQGIVSAIGSSTSHQDVLSAPQCISEAIAARGLDGNTAFEIISVDIADISVGRNIGARLRVDQADSDMRIAQAKAEVRRANAIALQQEMSAQVAANHATLTFAERVVPGGIAKAIRLGQLRMKSAEAANTSQPEKSASKYWAVKPIVLDAFSSKL